MGQEVKTRTRRALKEFDDPIVFQTTVQMNNRGIIKVVWAKPPELDI